LLAVACGALAAPAAAFADGQPDPSFNGTGAHVGSAPEGTIFTNVENRLPMVVQADGKIVVGGSRGGAMTLVRYNTDGSIDPGFGTGGFVTRQFAGTPAGAPGISGAVAMTQDAGGNIIAAGFGGSQSMVVARFTAAGGYSASAVCYAPHLIDFTARAVALRPDGSVVLAGYARDRHAAVATPGAPVVLYGQRATLTLPASGESTTACGMMLPPVNGLQQGSANVAIDGLNNDGSGADPARAGRFYDAVVALPDNRYVVASTSGPDGAAWVQRYTAAGAPDTFGAAGRLTIPATSLHALALLADGTVLAAGESVDAALAANRQMQLARISTTGGLGTVSRSRVAGGNNTGQAIAVLPDGRVFVAGSANLAGKTAFALTRFTADGVRDDSFGFHGEVTTPFGTPAINGYITGIALTGNFLAASGRLTNAAGLTVVAARYYATGAPPPPPPPPAASTLGVTGITNTTARVTGTVNANGTAANWWLEYGPSTSYGSKSPAQAVPATTNDIDVGVNLTGLAPGTLYHARIVISNGIGTTPGDDVTFTTTGAPGSGPAAVAVKRSAKKFCKVPKVTGKKVNRARKKVNASGCKAKVVYKKSKRPKGTVLKQSRKAGKKLGYRAVVKLTVAVKPTAKATAKKHA
jgi:uncharacterized delta-60 repeat protein